MEFEKERIELGCCTKMSEMKGINTISEYIHKAIERKWKAIGIMDFNSTQSFLEAEEYIKENNIKDLKILYGLKTKFVKEENIKNTYNIAILVKHQKGLKNLYTLLSKAFANKIDNEPIIHKSDLDKYREGLFYGSYGEQGEIYQNCYENDIDEKVNYYDFIEIEPLYNIKNNDKQAKEINKRIIELGNKNNVLVVATSNPLFIEKQDKICNEILRHSQGLKNIEFDNERYLHTTEQMLEEFNYIENEKIKYDIIVNNPNTLANMCEDIKIEPNKAKYPTIKNSKEIIKTKCLQKAKELYGEKLPKEVEKRLELELNSIIKNDFEFIYLLAEDTVNKSKEMGYLVVPRGSVGNSFVAYLLGITDYNPIEYNLPFEIFAGINYDKEPDIDLNFATEVQEKIFEYIKEKYGKDKVIFCGTIWDLSEKSAKEMVKKYMQDFEIPIYSKKIEELTHKLCGIKRRTGMHPRRNIYIAK